MIYSYICYKIFSINRGKGEYTASEIAYYYISIIGILYMYSLIAIINEVLELPKVAPVLTFLLCGAIAFLSLKLNAIFFLKNNRYVDLIKRFQSESTLQKIVGALFTLVVSLGAFVAMIIPMVFRK